jgi:hypothetical protein
MKAIEAEGGNELTDSDRQLAAKVDQESDAFQDSFDADTEKDEDA